MYVDGLIIGILIVTVIILWDRDKRGTVAIRIHHNEIEKLRSDVRMLERDVADLEEKLEAVSNPKT